jgi:predicted metal-dependent hydrolase
MESDGEERLFFQGMVQVSVGCYYLISGNFRGSLSQLKKGTKKLRSYLPSHRDIDLENLVSIIEPIIQELNDFISEHDPQMFRNKIPKIKLND